MLQHYRSHPSALERFRSEPLGPYLDSYLASQEKLGYSHATVRSQLGLLVHLNQWLARQELGVDALDECLLETFFEERSRRGHLHRNDPNSTRHLLGYLRRQGHCRAAEVVSENSPLERLRGRYRKYLTEERGVTATTVDTYQVFITHFVGECFGPEPLRPGKLTPSDVSAFVVRHAHSMSSARTKLMVTALRSFLRFLLQHGEIEVDLSATVPSVANWRLSTVPRFLGPDEIELVLASCDRLSAVGRRDCAILHLLARLGLRAGEIVALQLDDIDWRVGEIVVPGKGLVRDRLPLPHDVGEALAAYLRDGRPDRSPTRRVFIRAKAPWRGFEGPAAVSTLVRRALERAALCPPVKGAHLFRHSLATAMLRREASMAEIGQLLRHRAAQTTEIYAKVDTEGLRSLAQPWPVGGER